MKVTHLAIATLMSTTILIPTTAIAQTTHATAITTTPSTIATSTTVTPTQTPTPTPTPTSTTSITPTPAPTHTPTMSTTTSTTTTTTSATTTVKPEKINENPLTNDSGNVKLYNWDGKEISKDDPAYGKKVNTGGEIKKLSLWDKFLALFS